MVSWMRTITLIRNIIAHHGRLWNRVLINKYDWPSNTHTPILNYIPTNYQRRKIFPILSAISYMCDKIHPENHIRENLYKLFKEFDEIPLYKMGFPKDWKQQPLWIKDLKSK